jgi:hypothetical protein
VRVVCAHVALPVAVESLPAPPGEIEAENGREKHDERRSVCFDAALPLALHSAPCPIAGNPCSAFQPAHPPPEGGSHLRLLRSQLWFASPFPYDMILDPVE